MGSPRTCSWNGAIVLCVLIVAEVAQGQASGASTDLAQYSPLSQIRIDNIDELELAWSTPLGAAPGRLESTPVEVDGLIIGTLPWSEVVALDAETGRIVWRWNPQVNRYGADSGGPNLCCGPVNRGVAVSGGRAFVGVLDGRLVALDIKTGESLWSRQTTPTDGRYSITGKPLVAGSRVIIGNGGGDMGARGFFSAYDVASGALLWRFYTVPGDPASPQESLALERALGTWTGEWWTKGGGGTVWDGLAFDPETDLVYAGTGNGYPWEHLLRSPGGGDNLYLASILAVAAETGELAWHYQTMPGEQWDYTSTQHLVAAEILVRGAERRVVMQASKNGFYYVLDRATGELISAEAFAVVSWAKGVDRDTGRPIETPGARYDTDGVVLAPGHRGAHSWQPMAWSPKTQLAYISGENNSSRYRASVETQTRRSAHFPRSTPVELTSSEPGFLIAWDPVQQSARWHVGLPTGNNGGVLATAGDLVFMGSNDGSFTAYDAQNGSRLWSAGIGSGPATPVSIDVAGRQMIVVMSGNRMWAFALPPDE